MPAIVRGILRLLALLVLGYLVGSILLAGRRVLRGNRQTLVYHQPGCRFFGAKNCTESFSSERAAEAAGFSSANCCRNA